MRSELLSGGRGHGLGSVDSIVSVPELPPLTTYPTPERGMAFQGEGAGCAKAWREGLLNRPVCLGQVGV